MFLDLFSTFDPLTLKMGGSHPLFFWFFMVGLLSFSFNSLWVLPSLGGGFVRMIMGGITNFGLVKGRPALVGFDHQVVSLFFALLFINLMGVQPCVFSLSPHFLFGFCLSLPIWLGLSFSSMSYAVSETFARTVPSGSPLWLSSLLFCLEVLSVVIRPVTLALRLAVSLTAGQLILNLMSWFCGSVFLSGGIGLIFGILATFGFWMFEIFVCVLQSYVFCILLVTYASEHNS